ncbi:hypothetical protein IA57_01300 [Mangrovimonas yunxiaonensis]|uniref:RNA-binding protein n=1 Tax=Mangrovimonas yunxiaonensis TaxID=1197477 RepID=A0A084TNL5_9FLAO|nr:DUF721 domain-containing protein [Mangrovimonas yunxiaonensis]KFB02301.1 hypothetical protein IA57_01300 [Mangrovimonas yunxiaonensis]MBR9756493.1 DUF721 domain-containing protein [Algicola sp.]GGH39543.1 hypothetical protein GCM10011364_09000 [Mangrovimonas yunxiaonensis]
MKKRHNEHLSLSDVLKDFVETHNLDAGLDKVNVKNVWHDMMGQGVSNYTTAVSLKQDVLYVSLSSSVLREELSYGKEKIIDMLNDNLGKELIKKIIFR